MKEEKKPEKTEYQKIIDGEKVPEGMQKGWRNLEKRVSFNQMDQEKRKEICRKGAAAVNKLHGEKKTAKQALENILTLKIDDKILSQADLSPELADRLKRSMPDATLYDLINIVAVGRAVGGNMKSYELIRDTYGDAPVKQVEVTENITTDQDRQMLQMIAARLQEGGRLEVVKDIEAKETGTGETQ